MVTATEKKVLVLFHGGCTDGQTAAFCAWKCFGDDAEYRPAHYGQPAPQDVGGRDVYLLDFCYDAAGLRAIMAKATTLTVIDHHRSRWADLCEVAEQPQLAASVPADQLGTVVLARCNFRGWFNTYYSGARLAYDFFDGKQPRPWLIDVVEDRDLWRFALPFSREVSAYLRSLEFSFEKWDELAVNLKALPAPDRAWLNGSYMKGVIDQGAAIIRREAELTERICQNAVEITLGGHKVLAANSSAMQSEVAGKLAQGRPFGACWYRRADGLISWSLRSDANGIDVGQLAKRFGGGGHVHSAGFEVPAVFDVIVPHDLVDLSTPGGNPKWESCSCDGLKKQLCDAAKGGAQ